MTRVQVWSGHVLVFNLKRVPDAPPMGTMLIVKDDRLARGYIELAPDDVELMLAVLLRLREKQRDYAAAQVDKRAGKAPARR